MLIIGKRVIDAVASIAQKLGGTVVNTGNRLADNLDAIANVLEDSGSGVSGGAIENVEASTATTVSVLKEDFNALLCSLKNSGIMEPDYFSVSAQKITDSVAGHADRQYNSDKVNTIGINWADDKKSAVITVTLSAKVANLKDFDGGNGWGVHKWLGIGIGVGVSPITLMKYNGEQLTQADIDEAALCGMDSGAKFVRWIAADLVLAGDNTQKSKDTFTLWADGYGTVNFTIRIVEP